MIPWYKESFGLAYLDLYAHRDDNEAKKDIQTIVKLISPPEDQPLLDLGCGAGRHLCVLRDMGFSQLVGLDLSQELLDVAAKELTDPDMPSGYARHPAEGLFRHCAVLVHLFWLL